MQPTLNECDKDPRSLLARDFYKRHDAGVYQVHHAARAGFTMSMIAESINRGEKVLVLVPTNQLAKHIEVLAGRYSNKENPIVVRITPNKECLLNAEDIKECPDLEKIPVMPLPEKCVECNKYEECPLTRILREDWDVAIVTYHKLAALQLVPRSKNAEEPSTGQLIQKELIKAKNIISDECHELGYSRPSCVAVGDKDDEKKYVEWLIEKLKDYPNLCAVAKNFLKLVSNPEIWENICELRLVAKSSDYWKRSLSRSISIPECADRTPDVAIKFFKDLVKCVKEDVLHVKTAIILHHMFFITTSCKINVVAERTRLDVRNIYLEAPDTDLPELIGWFLSGMVYGGYKRIIMASATVGEHDYRQYFPHKTKIAHIVWGEKGDPMHTNRKLLILSDTKKYVHIGNNATWRNKSEMLYRITTIARMFNSYKVLVVMQTRREYYEMKRDLEDHQNVYVTHYRSYDIIGIGGDERIVVLVGAAHKPANAFDSVSETKDEALRRRTEAMHADTWQAMSRAKDAEGKHPSVVFALWCAPYECEGATNWGVGRRLKDMASVWKQPARRFVPECEIPVTAPKVVPCPDFMKMVTMGLDHMHACERNSRYDEKFPDGEPNQNTIVKNKNSSMVFLAEKKPSQSEDIDSVNNCEEISTALHEKHCEKSFESEPDYPWDSPRTEILDFILDKLHLPIASKYVTSDDTYTVESLTAYREWFEAQVQNNMRIEETTIDNPLEYLKKLHFPRYDHLFEQVIMKEKGREIAKYTGGFHNPEKLQKNIDHWIKSHIDGVSTLGVSILDQFANGISGCIDIDTHRDYGFPPEIDKNTPAQDKRISHTTEIEYRRKVFNTSITMELLLGYFDTLGLYPTVEQSGSPHSFHTWFYLSSKTSGKQIKSFMTALVRCAGVDEKAMNIEINPKQTEHTSKKRIGNQVKLPFAKHLLHGTRSKVWNLNAPEGYPRWQTARIFTPIVVKLYDISRIDFDSAPELILVKGVSTKAKKEPVITIDEDGTMWYEADTTEQTQAGKMDKFYDWALKQDLCGDEGHNLRIYVSRYYLNHGLSPEDVTKLFESQGNYNYETSLKYVRGLASVKCGYVRFDTLRAKCGSFVDKFEQETGIELRRYSDEAEMPSLVPCF